MTMQTRNKALAAGLSAVFLWSTMATAFSLGLREMDGLQLMLGASLVSIVVLLPIAAVRGRLALFRMIGLCELKRAAVLGLLNPFAYYAVLLQAYSILPAQEAMALNYLWPVMLVVLAIPLRGQCVSKGEWIALSIGFLGIIVVATQGRLLDFRLTDPLGDFFALGSSVIWALYWNLNARSECDAVVRLVLNLVFGSLYLFIAVLVFSTLELPTLRGMTAILYIGLFEMGITFFLWLTALRLAPSTARIGQMVFLAPFLSLFWIRLLLGENIHRATFAGMFLVVAGSLLQQHIARQRTSNK
jgi:drug/metabolite transporter (DMT)-like permease